MPPQAIQPEWLQYGSFGLIVFFVTVLFPAACWFLWQMGLRALETHRAIIAEMTERHEKLENQCREDRNRIAEVAEARAIAERASRNELNNSLHILSASIDVLVAKQS